MALFSKKPKGKSSDAIVLTDEDEILAYLDDVFRRRVALSVTAKGKTVSVSVMLIDLKKKAMRIQLEGFKPSAHGTEVTCGFSLDRTWWAFKSKLAFDQDKPYVLIPSVIKHAERRKDPRTSFTAREQVKVTVMEGLGQGNGVFGLASDIGPGGLCMIIDKAMELSSEKEIPPSPTLFKPGAPLAFVKINKVPGMGLIETSGIAKRVYRDGKWRCAIQLNKLSKAERAGIQRFVEPRVLEFKYIKRSMKQREANEVGGTEPSQRKPAARETSGPVNGSSARTATPPPENKPAAAKAETAAPATDKGKLLILGSELLAEMPFLQESSSPYEPVVGMTPVHVIRMLTEANPSLVLLGMEFKGRSTLEVLERIVNMGMAETRQFVLCAHDLQSKDRIKYKMMKVGTFVELPVKDKQDFFACLRG